MRHVFILNPAAGKGQKALALRQQIEAYFLEHPDMEYRCHETTCWLDAKGIAEKECEEGGCIRFYACGGDGTIQEVANGIPFGAKNVELAVVPCGSGNDFVRIFGGKERFSNLEEIIEGVTVTIDAIDSDEHIWLGYDKYDERTWCSLNIASIGLDASVGYKMQRYKHWPGVNGSMAYNLAVVDAVCHPIGKKMKIEIVREDKSVVTREGKFLMAAAANGQYYGGGYRGAPYAAIDDGLLDFVLVKKISRFRIPAVLSKYKSGRHEGVDCIEHIRGLAMKITATKEITCNVDGQWFDSDEIAFRIKPGAFRLVLPASVAEEFGFLSKGEIVEV